LMQVVPAAQQNGLTSARPRPQRAFTSPWHCAHRPVPWAASAKHWPRSGPGARVVQKSTQVEALAALDRDWEDGSGTPLPQATTTKAAASAPTRHRFMVAPWYGLKVQLGPFPAPRQQAAERPVVSDLEERGRLTCASIAGRAARCLPNPWLDEEPIARRSAPLRPHDRDEVGAVFKDGTLLPSPMCFAHVADAFTDSMRRAARTHTVRFVYAGLLGGPI